MTFSGLIREAALSIAMNRLRTFLAMLGIIIGVASVVIMLAVGAGTKRSVEEAISKLGSNLMVVSPGGRNIKGLRSAGFSFLTTNDAVAIGHLPTVHAVSAVSSIRSMQVAAGKKNWNTQVQGVTPAFFDMRSWVFTSGGSFTGGDVRYAQRVAVIGASAAEQLFPNQNALWGIVRINNQPFKIVGVLAAKGQGIDGQNQDDVIMVPLTAAENKLFGHSFYAGGVQMVYVQVISDNVMEQAEDDVTALLRQQHHLHGNMSDDFMIRSLTEFTQAASATAQSMAILLGAIASISLLVGGIGIMNIMLVTVAERTREIGVRKAVGASAAQIMRQFLLEAVMITGMGSFTGMAIGISGAVAAEPWLGIQTDINIWTLVLAISVAVVVGILSGIYPARKAASMEPVEALRVLAA